MPSSGTRYGDRLVATAKVFSLGLLRNTFETNQGMPADACDFQVLTGTTAHPDISPVAGTYALLEAKYVPTGMRCYITSLELYVGATLWGGGTAGTVSITVQDTAGTTIATYTQTALAAGAFVGLPLTATAPTGVTDALVRTMGASTAANQGIQVLVANSTTGTPVKVRVRGYFAP